MSLRTIFFFSQFLISIFLINLPGTISFVIDIDDLKNFSINFLIGKNSTEISSITKFTWKAFKDSLLFLTNYLNNESSINEFLSKPCSTDEFYKFLLEHEKIIFNSLLCLIYTSENYVSTYDFEVMKKVILNILVIFIFF